MKQYYIYINNEQQGPYNLEQLKGMYLLPDTLIWYVGLQEWIRCDKVPELQGIFPPQPPRKRTPPQPRTKENKWWEDIIPITKSVKALLNTILFSILMISILAAFGYFVYTSFF